MLTWAFTLETFARVAAWCVVLGFFLSLGAALFGYVPRGKPKAP